MITPVYTFNQKIYKITELISNTNPITSLELSHYHRPLYVEWMYLLNQILESTHVHD